MFDWIITGGTIIDGSGAARVRADIGIADGVISHLGSALEPSDGRHVIDATDRIVCPGFIDVHNHSDGWMLRQPRLDPKVLQGFTTEVLAADGISYAPVTNRTARQWIFYLRSLNHLRFDQYRGWQSLEEMLLAIDGNHVQNAATHIPFANLRAMACGWGRAPADDFQIREMQHQVQVGMAAGAVGLSTGLDYISQCFCDTRELVEVSRGMSAERGLYVTHIRYKKGLLEGLREAFDIGRRAEVPVHISHLKAFNQQLTDEVLELLESSARDVDLSFDVYPYQPGSTMLNYLLPYDVWEQGPLAAIDRLHRPEIRDKFKRGLECQRLDLEHISIAWLPSQENEPHIGKTLAEYVAFAGVPPAEALYDLLLEERMAVLCVMDEGDDALVRPFLQHPKFMLGSDGIYHPSGHTHPRMFGSAGRLLGPCVRDLQLFTLEDAVRKMTSYPAERFGLERGILKTGAVADVVVFDAHRITDQATYAEPRRPTVGVDWVLVGGTPILENGECTTPSALPGRFLRRAKSTSHSNQ